MKSLLMISTDAKIFQEESSVRRRQIEYAKNWSEVHIIIFSSPLFDNTIISQNCFVYPTRSLSRFVYILDAIKIGFSILKNKSISNITCQDPFLTAISASYLANKFKIPLEIQIHTDIGSPNYSYSFLNKIRKIRVK